MGRSRELEGVINSLMDSANDRETVVQEAVETSLYNIGVSQPDKILSAIHAYLARHTKIPPNHRGVLLRVINKICLTTTEDKTPSDELTWSKDTAALVINLAVQEMTMFKETQDFWQSQAASILVTLSKLYCHNVVDVLLQKFTPGTLPHYYVAYALGEIALANAFEFVPFLLDILSRLVPLLSTVKPETQKLNLCSTLKKFCMSILDYVANIDKAPDETVKTEIYSELMGSAYDVIFGHWLPHRDQKLRGAAIECVGEMTHILSVEKLKDEIRKLIPTFLSMYKKQTDPFYVTAGLCRVLEAAIKTQPCPVEPFLEDIWVCLFAQVVGDVDYNNPVTFKNQNEVLRSFHITSILYADKLCYYLLQKLHGSSEKSKISALVILRHLINSAGPYMEDKKSLIILGLKPVLNDTSNRVKRHICQLAVALADHGYLEGDGGSLAVEFLLRNLCLPDESDSNSSTRKGTGDGAIESTTSPNNVTIKGLCSTALQVLTKSVQQAEKVLWPYLFEFICVEAYTPAIGDIFRSLATLAHKMNEENRLKVPSQNSNEKMPGPFQIMCRLIVTLSVPGPNKRGLYALSLLKELCEVFSPTLKPVWSSSRSIPFLEKLLESSLNENTTSDGESFQEKKLEKALMEFVEKTVAAAPDADWSTSFVAALGKQFHLYASRPEEKQFLFKCMGIGLSVVKERQFVIDHLDLMFQSANHNNSMERQGCAAGFGLCASCHVDLVLTKLENIAKAEFQRKNSGLFSFFKDIKGDTDSVVLKLKATLLLCYGFVSYYCPTYSLPQRLEITILRFLTPHFENAKDSVVKQSLLQTIDLIATSVHPSHLSSSNTFSHRGQLLIYIKMWGLRKSERNIFGTCRGRMKVKPSQAVLISAGFTLVILKCFVPYTIAWFHNLSI